VTMIQFECNRDQEIDILEVLKRFSVQSLKMYSSLPKPPLPSDSADFENRAQMIAKTIQPRPGQTMRRDALITVLRGSETFWDQSAEPDPALRNATGALSKALRKFAPFAESPLEILCDRRREVFSKGPMKGQYKGTRYVLTRLGNRVKEILIEKAII
jgi:hypothetical protein